MTIRVVYRARVTRGAKNTGYTRGIPELVKPTPSLLHKTYISQYIPLPRAHLQRDAPNRDTISNQRGSRQQAAGSRQQAANAIRSIEGEDRIAIKRDV